MTSPQNYKINKCYWISRNELSVTFDQDWPENIDYPSFEVTDNPQLTIHISQQHASIFGLTSGYYVSDTHIYFVLSKSIYPTLQFEYNQYYIVGDFNGWEVSASNAAWQLHTHELAGIEVASLALPVDLFQAQSQYAFKFIDASKNWLKIPDSIENTYVDAAGNRNYRLNMQLTGKHIFNLSIENYFYDFKPVYINWIGPGMLGEPLPVDYFYFLKKLKTDQPLGAYPESDRTTLRIFAPRATEVHVQILEQINQPIPDEYPLVKNSDGTWQIIIRKNLSGKYYFYTIHGPNSDSKSSKISNITSKVVDPYTLVVAAPDGPGMIIDRATLTPLEDAFQCSALKDLVIIEAHIQDIVGDSSSQNFPEQNALINCREWLQHTQCYLKEANINAVELMPLQSFELQQNMSYNWGYMPTNYFAPASTYVHRDAVKEMQLLVKAFHDAGIAVILDVVYNHVGNPNHLSVIDKECYFHVNIEGTFRNHSGCGNDLDADSRMTRRLILDSLIHWLCVYNVDGFRFDLAEILGVHALYEIELQLKRIKPSVILIAEPWSFYGHIARDLKPTGFASWNDGYRNYITDYILGHGVHSGLRYYLEGSSSYLSRFTAQSINYVSSHDDYCWIDKITQQADHNGTLITNIDRRRTHLMIALMSVSMGVPMFAAGTERFHSKKGIFNTYCDRVLNKLSDESISAYSNTYVYFCDWIRLRLSTIGVVFRPADQPTSTYFQYFLPHDTIALAVIYNADNSQPGPQILFAINPHVWGACIPVEGIEPEDFLQIADHERVNPSGLGRALLNWQKDALYLPAISCGLWIRSTSVKE